MRRLLLVRHAPTPATRAFAFPADEALDERGREAATTLQPRLPTGCAVLCSPARRCRETVAAAGLGEPTVEPALAECDFGRWVGRTLDELMSENAEAVSAWMSDPSARPHGGECLGDFLARVGGWLEAQARLDGSALAVTHGGVLKAAVVHALGAPVSAFWRVDAAPLSTTELHAHDGRWTLTRANVPVAGATVEATP